MCERIKRSIYVIIGLIILLTVIQLPKPINLLTVTIFTDSPDDIISFRLNIKVTISDKTLAITKPYMALSNPP